jgi:hypothetical protein
MDDDDFFAQIARATIDINPPTAKRNFSAVEPTSSASRKRTRSSAAIIDNDVKLSSNDVIIIDDDSDFIISSKRTIATDGKGNDKQRKSSPHTNLTLEEEMQQLEEEENGSKKRKKGEKGDALFYKPPVENAVLHETKTQQKKLLDRISRLKKGGPLSPMENLPSAGVFGDDEVEEVAERSDDELRREKTEKKKKEKSDKAEDTRSLKLTFRTIDNFLPSISVKAKLSFLLEKVFSRVIQAWIECGKVPEANIKAVVFKANGEKLTADMHVRNLAEDGIDELQVDAFLPK